MNALQEWLRAASTYSPEDVQVVEEILRDDRVTAWTVSEMIEIYCLEDSAIGEYARAKQLDGLPLASLEEQWIKDPEGEQCFFSRFRSEHPNEWKELMDNIGPLPFMFFQLCWIFNPTRQYLISLGHGGYPSKTDFYPKDESDPEKSVFARLRDRFEPFKERLVA